MKFKKGKLYVSKLGTIVEYLGEGIDDPRFRGQTVKESPVANEGLLSNSWRKADFKKWKPAEEHFTFSDKDIANFLTMVRQAKEACVINSSPIQEPTMENIHDILMKHSINVSNGYKVLREKDTPAAVKEIYELFKKPV